MTSSAAGQRAIHPRLLRLAQLGWVFTLVLSLVLFAPSVIQVYQDQRVACTGSGCTPDQPNATAAHNLSAIGWTTQTYARFVLILSLVTLLVWLSVGLFIAWRKWTDVMALLISAQAVTQSVSQVTSVEMFRVSIWFVPALALSFLSGMLLFLLFALFPSGQFVPRWLKWLAVGFALFESLTLPVWPDAIANTLFAVANALWYVFMGILIVCQIYRYARISSPVERQQTKWVIFAFSFVIIGQFVVALPQAFSASLAQPYSLYSIMLNPADTIILLVAPFCIAIAILRYRLYDIDLIIKRTLVYGSLTAILAALYFGLVIGAQQLTRQITAQQVEQQPVVIVLTTLLIAALFTPLRSQLQRWIDRRFYRSRYDAAKTLSAFSASLRSEVDLGQLNDQLLEVVDDTMRPATASLWLREPSGPRHEARGSA
ncbi:MAG TPA: hypothetical protein VFX31_04905 [Ktedonobacterales bacterium]|nr:hypothetical protein [Ktedonobacterales bacterium]